MKSYYRVMLGKQSVHAATCFANGYIGIDDDLQRDIGPYLTDDWRHFNAKMVPEYLKLYPDKSRIAAGLACGVAWTVCKGILKGDIVLCPDGKGTYRVGEIIGDYDYLPGEDLPLRRAVHWFEVSIERASLSDALKRSTGSIGTVANVSGYREELEAFIGGKVAPKLISTDETVEDASAFALEKHLEDFLVQNWAHTDLGKNYDIYEEDGAKVGQQYLTDTGPMDILAIKKDKSELLVVELKKGRASDVVVGQTLRYMGFAALELAEPNQKVRGVIIALEDDQRIRRALAVAPNIDFFRYQISFKLIKA
ncbi:endonuclease NucS domain-containing protein [Dechloromonas sp. H13]|uniref:endonuclease NucS domain-containing protein n=1 Tax=Dechloromonas sp. H13 TaxID=2570193 RepID=UPI0012910C3D|nr:endonuclease NucS domain-containing protein [Dechloromonas sp. H13]